MRHLAAYKVRPPPWVVWVQSASGSFAHATPRPSDIDGRRPVDSTNVDGKQCPVLLTRCSCFSNSLALSLTPKPATKIGCIRVIRKGQVPSHEPPKRYPVFRLLQLRIRQVVPLFHTAVHLLIISDPRLGSGDGAPPQPIVSAGELIPDRNPPFVPIAHAGPPAHERKFGALVDGRSGVICAATPESGTRTKTGGGQASPRSSPISHNCGPFVSVICNIQMGDGGWRGCRASPGRPEDPGSDVTANIRFRTNRSCRLAPAHEGMKIGCIG